MITNIVLYQTRSKSPIVYTHQGYIATTSMCFVL